jgi:hypothetical protein
VFALFEDWVLLKEGKMRSKWVFTTLFLSVFCMNAYGIRVSVPGLSAEPGSTVTVEINVDDATGILGGDIGLEYDPAILEVEEVRALKPITDWLLASDIGLEVEEVRAAKPITDWLLAWYTAVEGKVTLAMAGTSGLAGGSGAILEVDFEVKADASGESPLVLSDVALFDEMGNGIPVETTSGKITVRKAEPAGPPVVREHSPGSPMLVLQATYNEANVHGYTYVDIWSGSVPIETGQFLEFQVAMFSGNPAFNGTVDLHTTDGSTLRDAGARDQNNVSAHPSADLSEYARDQWYHRKISLDALAGKVLDGVMIATDSNEHRAGIFRVYVDNIQITDGEVILTTIHMDENIIPITGASTATGTDFAGTEGMSDYSVTTVGATSVAPRRKSITSWGGIKGRRSS